MIKLIIIIFCAVAVALLFIHLLVKLAVKKAEQVEAIKEQARQVEKLRQQAERTNGSYKTIKAGNI